MRRPISSSSASAARSLRSARGLRSGRRSAGFTLIEVMIAVGILTVGSVGILAMQQASTRGNLNARQMTTATNVTRVWVERVRRDALAWRSNITGDPNGVGSTNYIQLTPVAGESGWFAPNSPNVAESFGFNWHGEDTAIAGEMRYCTHINSRWVVQNQVARVDVRTFWYRRGDGAAGDTNQDLFPGCAAGGGEAAVTAELMAAAPRVHSVYASTLVRWRSPQ